MSNIIDYHVLSITPLAEQISRVQLTRSDKTLHYQAGQYVEVQHQDKSESALSIACAPNAEGLLEFHVSHTEKNKQARDLMRIAHAE